MNYGTNPRTERHGWSRMMVTLIAVCLPILAATFFSGSFFKLGTVEAGQVFDGGTAHAASVHNMDMSSMKGNTPSAVAVSIQNNSFVPNDVTIAPGTMVTWTNNNGTRARVRDSGHVMFDSSDLNPGQSYSYTFVTSGVITVVEERGGFTSVVRVTGTAPTGTPGTPGGTTTPGATTTAGGTTTPGTPGATNTAVGGNVVEVQIVSENFPGYSPASITVQSGTTIRWRNVSGDEHSSTSPGAWDSGAIARGGTFETTLVVNGTYNYFCMFHPDMAGSVTVVGGPTATPQPTGTVGTGTVDVGIQTYAFTPQNLTVLVGTTVRWTNHDADTHSATSNTGAFDSGALGQNQQYSFTFNTVGTFSYHCSYHPGMTGTITVVASLPTDTPATAVPTQTSTAQPSTTAQPSVSTTPSAPVDVSISGFAFTPQNITVQVGTTVRWTNHDTTPHTVTEVNGVFNSGGLALNATYSFTFNTPGTYNYACSYHSGMTGSITVVNAGPTTTATAQASVTGTAQATGTTTVQPTSTSATTAQPSATHTVQPTPGIVNVAIQGYAYNPITVTVQAGTTVKWTNLDNDLHSVTEVNGLFDSGTFALNGTFSHTFNTPGTYQYYCTVHGAF
ncbi:MAG: cupredoxin domain-containing protein, partial [Chloroflexia bacterium]